MKAITRFSVLVLLLAGWIPAFAQGENAEVPGDHFSLEGALELFKKSSSPEEFEKMLNSPDAKVNNLDLNGDGYVDYIRVLDRQEGNVHLFILQAVVSEYESQDVAVIELEKLANGKAVLQIVGDEDIYGVTTIIEPTEEVRTYAGTRSSSTVVNVWAWPTVQYVYGPRYVVWVSPWSWRARPVWWHTWRPVAYVHYYSVWRPYHRHYVVAHSRRVVHAHTIYAPYRTTSVIVHNRHNHQIKHYRDSYADSRNGRTRTDRTRNTDQGNSSGRTNGRTRSDYNGNSRSTYQRETTTTSNRPASRERSATPTRSSYEPRKTSTPAKADTRQQAPQRRTETTTPRPAQRNTSDFSRSQSDAPAKTQRPATRQRQSSTMNSSSTPTRTSNVSRSSSTPRQQVSKPASVERRSSPAPTRQQQPTRSSGRSDDVRRTR